VEARRAHNPEVGGSKLPDATLFSHFSILDICLPANDRSGWYVHVRQPHTSKFTKTPSTKSHPLVTATKRIRDYDRHENSPQLRRSLHDAHGKERTWTRRGTRDEWASHVNEASTEMKEIAGDRLRAFERQAGPHPYGYMYAERGGCE
jgi:hypothetical protein